MPEKRSVLPSLLNIFLFSVTLEQKLKQDIKFVAFLLLLNNPSGTSFKFVQLLKQPLKTSTSIFLSNNSFGILSNVEQF